MNLFETDLSVNLFCDGAYGLTGNEGLDLRRL